MSRRYFVCSTGEVDQKYERENFARCEAGPGHFMHRDTIHKGVFDDVTPGDIIFLRVGNLLVAYGVVTKTSTDENEPELGDWNYRLLVKNWVWKDPANHRRGVSRYGIKDAILGGDVFATIKEVNETFAMQKMNEIGVDESPLLQECRRLLEKNHNLILHGAPGTGKTFLAKKIAESMDAEWKFVQFHPSYDYTDFVEGLRPVRGNADTIGFVRREGIFMSLCIDALSNLLDSEKEVEELNREQSIEVAYHEMVDAVNEGVLTQLQQYSGVPMLLSVNSAGSLEGRAQDGEHRHSLPMHTIVRLARKYPDIESLKKVQNFHIEFHDCLGSWCYASGCWAILNYIYSERMQRESSKAHGQVKRRNYVMIIDEINRAEMSKVLGELFFSIDPGYRGTEGAVYTQYANLVEEATIFDEVLNEIPEKRAECSGRFFVPENVYIIGTMNDIDRSVDRMDFAMRRRFAFKEILAADTADMLDSMENGVELKSRMNRLNDALRDNEVGLGSEYHIGASYFLKYKNFECARNPYEDLWNLHLKGLLKEYLRGMDPDGAKLEYLRKAYEG